MIVNVNEQVTVQALGHCTHWARKQVLNKTTGDIYASAKDAAKILGTLPETISAVCRGVIGPYKGNKLEYLSKTSGNTESMMREIKILRSQVESMKEDAAVGRAIREEREAKQKEEAKRIKILEDAKQLIVTLTERLARRERMVVRKEAEYMHAIDRYNETERELREAELNLLKLEGKVTE